MGGSSLRSLEYVVKPFVWNIYGKHDIICNNTNTYLYVLLTVHFSNIWFLVSNLMHLFIISFNIPLHVSSHIVLIIRRIHRIYTASGSLCVTLLVWPFGAQVVRGLTACAPNGHTRRVTHKEPDAVYMRWILLMMSTIWLETCRGIWKDIINKCIRLETRNQISLKCTVNNT